MRLQRFTPTTQRDPRFWDQLNRIVEAVNKLLNITGGPGVAIRQNAGGISISATPVSGRAGAGAAPELTGDPKALAHVPGTQDADTYSRADDNVPVQITVITDITYDATEHKLIYRTRTLTCAYVTSVTAESDPVVVDTLVPHPS